MKNINNKHSIDSGYSWFIIGLCGISVMIVTCVPLMSMPVFFKEISGELNLSIVELGTVWGLTQLASMIMTPVGGLVGDRIGTKRTMIIICILVGIAGASRAFSVSFFTLSLTMFVFGALYNTVVLNAHKSASIWLSGRNVGIANGIISASIAIGLMIGAGISDTIMSPLLGGWRNVLVLYGAVSAVVGLLWIFTKSAPAHQGQSAVQSPPFMESLMVVVKTRALWSKAVVQFCYIGSFIAVMGYLSLYLRGIGWQPAAADGASAVLNGAGIISAVPLAILSGRIASKRKLISVLLAISVVTIFLVPFFSGAIIWPLVLFFGLIRDGYLSIMVTMVMETEGIGSKYAGTATGIILSSGSLGGFFSATVGSSLATINPQFTFIFLAVLIFIAFVVLNVSGKKKAIL